MTERPKIILDTDIGDDIDDAYAIAMLLEEDVDILGITTVYRNSAQRAKITKRVLDCADANNIGVYAGVDEPEKQKVFLAHFERYGEDGKVQIPHYDEQTMGGYTFSEVHAVDFILDALEKHPNEIILCAIGPLSNLAAAYKKSPETFKKAKELLIMGADMKFASREWNVLCDPEAFDVVIDSGVPIRLITVDFTKLCEFSEADIEKIAAKKGTLYECLYSMMHKWMTDSKRSHLPTMYDGLALSVLTHDFVQFEEMGVRVELSGENRGKTYISESEGKRMLVNSKADVPAFMAYMRKLFM